jgi:hypothetical protein
MRLMLIFHFDINVGANGSSIVTLETASYLLKIYYHSIGVAIFVDSCTLKRSILPE